jgi:hypothetical protein
MGQAQTDKDRQAVLEAKTNRTPAEQAELVALQAEAK